MGKSSDQSPAQSPEPYTGKTIIKPRQRSGNTPPALPAVPRVYQNPPPSQRKQTRRNPTPPAAATPVAAPAPARAVRRSRRTAEPSSLMTGVRRLVRRVILLLVVLLAVGVLAGVLLYRQIGDLAEQITVADVRGNPSLASPLIGGMNVLLIGVDEREGYAGEGVRSDTLMLLRVDAGTGTVHLLSIPRDSYAEIPSYGGNKINVAYGHGYAFAEQYYGAGTTPQQGGMMLATQTVEAFLNLPARGARIDYTAQINFDGFIGIIDALGGIEIDVPFYIIDYEYPTPDFGIMTVEFQPGVQRMDGATALIYARTRHYDSDFGRAERQQQVVRAILSEIKSRSWAERMLLLPKLTEAVASREGQPAPIKTTLPLARPDVLIGLGVLASRFDPDQIQQFHISPETIPNFSEYGSDLYWDDAQLQALLSQFFGSVPVQ
jgi:LCP family protein required for cell wall assembly